MKKSGLILACFLFCVFFMQSKFSFSESISDDEKTNSIVRKLNFSVNYFSYISYSPVNQAFPFEKGYPSFNTNTAGLHLDYSFKRRKLMHHLNFSAILPSKITSDNGTGNNYLLKSSESRYNRLELKYYFFDSFYSIKNIDLLYGFTSSAFYENRNLFFKSGDIIRQQDINIGLGPTLGFKWSIIKSLILKAEGHFLIYLPYISYGDYSFESNNADNRTDKYHTIVYKTFWQLSLDQKIKENISLFAGYRNINQSGFGNSKNSLVLNNIIVSKMDIIREAFIGISIHID